MTSKYRNSTPARSALLAATLLTLPAYAQDAAAPTAPAHHAVDGEKILKLLVDKGLISQSDAEGIEAQASAAPPPPPAAIAGGVNGDVQTIPYVPETVRRQIKDELRTEVKQEAKAEGWAQPGLIPDWLSKVTLSGDMRVRDEQDLFDKNNDTSNVNFSAINSGSPYNINRNVAGSPNPPYLNTTEDRNRVRVRARLGVLARPDDWVAMEFRVSTGNDPSPVSPNQTLGGGGGNFSKYSLWVDRANIQFTPVKDLRIDLGRSENPFWTTALLFYPDLNFDGFAARYRYTFNDTLEAFGTAGAFPIFNTDLNFGSRDAGAFSSRDKWLYGGQLGARFNATKEIAFTGAVAYFDFSNAQGQFSDPCPFNQDVCDTDVSRPQFQQYGNSVFPIRNIVPDPTAAPGLSPEPQYFGLASKFQVLDLHGALDLNYYPAVPLRVEFDLLRNLAFDKAQVQARQVNVVGGPYNPGGDGWSANLIVGKPNIDRRGDWNASVGYRYLQTDAVIDGIADADFHLGGTNARGYVLMGYYGIARNTSLGLRYFSADQITGMPYSVDVVQFDLNTRF